MMFKLFGKKSTSKSCSRVKSPIKVLGSGCKKCNDLEKATVTALEQLGMDSAVEHVTDFAQIGSYGVMNTPALVVDGKVVSSGKLLTVEEIVEILKQREN